MDELRSKVRGGSAEQISRELYFCLKKLGAEEQQAALVEAVRTARGIPAAEEAAREWNVVMQLLNEMAHLLGGQGVTFARRRWRSDGRRRPRSVRPAGDVL